MISCGKTVDLTGGRIKGPLQGDVEALLLGAGTVIGEIEALLDEGVDIDQPMFARSFARVQQHVLDDGVGAFAVLNDLVEIVAQGVRQFGYFSARLGITFILSRASRNSSISSAETPEKLLTKLSGFLISWAIPAVN